MSTSPAYADSPLSSARHCFAVIPSDSAALERRTKGLYVGVTGDVVLRASQSAADVTFRNVPAGMILDVQASHVRATGTTASAIVALA